MLDSLGAAAGSVLTSPEAIEVATAVAKGAASTLAGQSAKKLWHKVAASTETRALHEPIALAFVRAIEVSRIDEDANAVLWWTTSGERLLKPFTDREVAESVMSASLAAPGDRENAQGAFLAALERRHLRRSLRFLRWRRHNDGDFEALSADLGINGDQFLHVLPGTIFDEIQRAAHKVDSPLRGLAESATQREIASLLAANQVAALSPWALLQEVSRLLELEHAWHVRMLRELPYLEGHPDPLSLDIAVEVTVGLRRGIEEVQPGDDAVYQPAAGRALAGRNEPVPLAEAIAECPRLVVLADPGIGKTWLIHTQAARTAAESLRRLQDIGTVTAELVVPAALRCDTLAARMPMPLARAACALLAERHDMSPALRLWLEQHLQSGAAVYLLDALDEVPHAERGKLSEMVRAWELTEAASGAAMVVTSRIAGYQGIFDPAQRVEAELLPFAVDDVSSYVQSWRLPPAVVAPLQDRLRSPALVGLARVPLLLALLCQLAREPELLPTTRAEIYGRILRRFLRAEHRDIRSTIDMGPLVGAAREREQRLRRLLRPVAFAFADSDQGWVDQMPGADLLDVLASNSALLPAGVDAPAVLTHLSITAGVLIPAGDDRAGADPPYLWVHRSVAEYLVAEHLTTVNTTDLNTVIDRHLWFDVDWAPVWPLLGAVLAARNRLSELLEYLLGQQADPLHQALMTAAAVIAELDPAAAADARRVTDQTAGRLLMLMATPARLQAARHLARVLPYASPTVRAEIQAAVLQHFDSLVRREAASALAWCSGPIAIEALLALVDDWDLDVRTDAARAVARMPGQDVTNAVLAMPCPHTESQRMVAVMLHRRPGQDVTDALLTLARDDEDQVRREAANALIGRPSPEVTDAFIVLAGDRDRGARLAAARGLAASEESNATDALLRVLRDSEDREMQEIAGDSLRERPDKATTDALIALTRNDKWTTRRGAAAALSGRPGQDVTDALIARADDDVDLVKQAAARALSGRPGQDVTEALIALSGSDDDQVRFASLTALADRSGHDVTDALITLARDGYDRYIPDEDEIGNFLGRRQMYDRVLDVNRRNRPRLIFTRPGRNEAKTAVRLAALRALRDRPGEDVTEALTTVARDSDKQLPVRVEAVMALASRPGQEATKTLTALADHDDNEELRQAATAALSPRPGDDVANVLTVLARDGHISSRDALELLDDKDDAAATKDASNMLRYTAVVALRDRPETGVTETLIGLADDDSALVRAAAVKALQGRPSREVTEVLLRLARGTDPDGRAAAAKALRRRPGQDVTNALIPLASDDNVAVRDAAIAALDGRPGSAVTAALITAATDAGSRAESRSVATNALVTRTDPLIAKMLADVSAKPLPWASDTDRIAQRWYEIAKSVASNSQNWPTAERVQLIDALSQYTAAALKIEPSTGES